MSTKSAVPKLTAVTFVRRLYRSTAAALFELAVATTLRYIALMASRTVSYCISCAALTIVRLFISCSELLSEKISASGLS